MATILLLAGVGCARTTGGAAPSPPRPADAAPPASASSEGPRPAYVAADVRFMQRMLAHHAQALEMTALVSARAGREDVRRLAERIEVSQRDEIAAMRRWLGRRGEPVPDTASAHAHHGAGERPAAMPGMATAAEMARLAAAAGAEFDRLFIQLMIRHHEGALAMVAELFATPGAGRESEVFRFATDVDADQRAEIRRMRAMLAAPGAPRDTR